MITSERAWLRDQQPHDVTLHQEATDRALAALRAHITAGSRRSIVRPLRGSPRRPERRTLARATRVAAAVAIAGAMGIAVAAVLGGAGATSHSRAAGGTSTGSGAFVTAQSGHGHGPSLLRVADHLRTETETVGNATLVIRSQAYPGKAPIVGADLYTDRGEYFFAHDKSGLGAQIAAGNNQADGLFAREVAAAKDAAITNDIDVARARMADAPDPAKPITPGETTVPKLKVGGGGVVSRFDNYLWGDSLDALQAGAGNPQVRAGVLRLLATMNDVTVARTTTDGQATLTLTAGGAVFGGGYQEQMIINAGTGVPVSFIGGDPSRPSVTVTYDVERVATGDLTQGS
jgi:hypothetical protein